MDSKDKLKSFRWTGFFLAVLLPYFLIFITIFNCCGSTAGKEIFQEQETGHFESGIVDDLYFNRRINSCRSLDIAWTTYKT